MGRETKGIVVASAWVFLAATMTVCTPGEQEQAVRDVDTAICRAVIDVDGGASEELLRGILASLRRAELERRDGGPDR